MTTDRIDDTSRWIAALRARESEHPDRLFDDPLASVLAGPEGFAFARALTAGPLLEGYVAIGTRFFDDFLLQSLRAPFLRQVVLVGAGMDTRAFRLPWPEGTEVFELDRPTVLEYKQARLIEVGARERCTRHTLGVDLVEQWGDPLRQAGFDPARPSVWLLQGLLVYLDDHTVHALLRQVTRLASPGSRLGVDVPGMGILRFPLVQPWLLTLAHRGAAWRFGTDDPEGLVADLGWEPTVVQPGEAAAHYGRWPFPVVTRGLPVVPRLWMITAHLPPPSPGPEEAPADRE